MRAGVVVLSYNDESWIELDELVEMCRARGHVEVLAFASTRYVGARIGIHNPAGAQGGSVARLRNLEYVLVAGRAGPGAVDGRAVVGGRALGRRLVDRPA